MAASIEYVTRRSLKPSVQLWMNRTQAIVGNIRENWGREGKGRGRDSEAGWLAGSATGSSSSTQSHRPLALKDVLWQRTQIDWSELLYIRYRLGGDSAGGNMISRWLWRCGVSSARPWVRRTDKKLSYCCESRSYWLQEYDRLKQLLRDTLSISTLSILPYIHCDRSVSTCE